MANKQLPRKLRHTIVFLLAVLFIAAVWGNVYVYKKPMQYQTTIPAYSYKINGNLDYRVTLLPNDLIAEPVVGSGKAYYSRIVDKINVAFSCIYTGDLPASRIKGAYEVVAVTEDPEVWRKEYILVPLTEVYGSGTTLSLRGEFPVDINNYNSFIKKIFENFGSGPKDPQLEVQVRLYWKTDTSEGLVQENLAPKLFFPLNTGVFRVEGDTTFTQEGSLNKEVTNIIPLMEKLKKMQIFLLFIPLLPAVAIFMVVILTENKVTVTDPVKKMLNTINKKYSDRLVMVNENITPAAGSTEIICTSMEDLVKVADELGKPILYQNPEISRQVPTYRVFDGLSVFRHTPDLAEDSSATAQAQPPAGQVSL